MKQTQVLIAGGGPVGMTLAYDLARRGVQCMLVEKNPTTTAHPKMDITNGRTMELFRLAGLADALRVVAVHPDHCFDVSWVTRMNGTELARFGYASVSERQQQIRGVNDGTLPLEAPMRVSQVEIEPVLKRAIDAQPLVDVRFGVEIDSFVQDDDGVTVTVRLQSGALEQIRCGYLAGCDGGGSRVRTILGVPLSGEARIMQRFMTHFRSDALQLLQRWGVAWHYQSAYGTLIAQNDKDLWTLHSRIAPGVPVESVDPAEEIRRFVGEDIPHEVLVSNPWSPHLLVADSYHRGRVFLAGDAAHQYIPTGGYGMNTGVADAFDLGWKLAAVVRGYGGQALLDSYEIERRPVGLRNCAGSRRHNDVRVQNAALYSPLLDEQSPAGDAAREHASRVITEARNLENESWGLEFGYCYQGSPVVAREEDAVVHDDPLVYVPNCVPGSRLPSVWLPDGSAVYDHLGLWLSVIAIDDTSALTFKSAATSMGVPLNVVQVSGEAANVYGPAPLLLVRPDQHIAWRGAPPGTSDEAAVILRMAMGIDTSATASDSRLVTAVVAG